MLLPISVNNKEIPCVFVKTDDEGFWLIAPGKRLLGEAQELESHKTNLRELELNSTWLVLEIVESNFQSLVDEILTKNPTELSQEDIDMYSKGEAEDALKIECEIYVRNLVQNFRLEHPLLKKYKQRIGDLYIQNRIFPYQVTTALACLSNRFVNEQDVILDKHDDEKGVIPLDKVRNGKITVGLPNLSFADIKGVSEDLIIEIYNFSVSEQNNLKWLSTKEKTAIKDEEAKEIKPPLSEDELEKKAVKS